MQGEKNRRLLVIALIAVIVVLIGIVVYFLAVRPAITGYAIESQNQGIELAVVSIMQQAAQCQPVPLTFQNQTINVFAVECLQQSQQDATVSEESQ